MLTAFLYSILIGGLSAFLSTTFVFGIGTIFTLTAILFLPMKRRDGIVSLISVGTTMIIYGFSFVMLTYSSGWGAIAALPFAAAEMLITIPIAILIGLFIKRKLSK